MTPDEIEAALERAERALAEGHGLKGTGFWGAVATVRRENRSVDTRRMDQGATQRLALRDRPQPGGTVAASRQQGKPIRAKGSTPDGL